jgi:hypothetical protein
MLTDRTWEEETLTLIENAKKEERRAEQRVASAERALQAARRSRAALEHALHVYRKSYGIEESKSVDLELAAEFKDKSIKDMLTLWADKHGGQVVMKDITTFLTAAGFFQRKQQASGALYSTAQRSPEFERVSRGVFQRMHGLVDTVEPVRITNGHDTEESGLLLGEFDPEHLEPPPDEQVDAMEPTAEDEEYAHALFDELSARYPF